MDRYEESLERARIAYSDYKRQLEGIEDKTSNAALMLMGSISALELQYAELREREGERIRKALKSYFDSEISDYGNVEWRYGIKYAEVIAWLEKQGEQKPAKCSCIPSRDMILNVWDLSYDWREITKGIVNTEHGTQLEYVIKHWTEGSHYKNIKSAWSEEDERMINNIEWALIDKQVKEQNPDKFKQELDWLKAFKP